MILRGQTTATFFIMQRRIAQRSMSRYRPFIYFVRKVRYLSKFNYELLIFEILKMISIHATTLCLRSSLCGIIIIARKFEHQFCLFLSYQNKGNCKCYNKDLFRFVMTSDHHWLNLFALTIKVSLEKVVEKKTTNYKNKNCK